MTDSPEPKATGGEVSGQWKFADAEQGCTLFIPSRSLDPNRSAAIVEHARRWWQGESEATN